MRSPYVWAEPPYLAGFRKSRTRYRYPYDAPPRTEVRTVLASKPVNFRQGHDGLAASVKNGLGSEQCDVSGAMMDAALPARIHHS